MGTWRALAAIAVAIATLACTRTAPPPLPAPTAEPDRFPHPAHATLTCTPCHDQAAAVAGAVRVPGSDDHAACDAAACHGPAFMAPPDALCRVCHVAVDPTRTGASPLRPYPAVDGLRSLPSRFSHAVHLDNATIEDAVGFNVACTDCHEVDADGRPATAGHRACARCHADEVGLVDAPAMSTCAACHLTGVAARTPRRMIVRDVRFDHGRHRADARGAVISCSTCHRDSRTADRDGRLPKPVLAACVACHDDPARVPITKRMRVCETCHASIALTFGALAPRSHLPDTERPVDHTLAFRRDHAAEAADGRRCAGCHTMMSGAREASCDECHQVMRPSDHNLTWRELDHGAPAIADRDRCATCHVADACSACHQQRPRSHGPFGTFGSGDHGDLARQNPATCITCHDIAADCQPCHSGAR
ncbi:MAG: cytochrome c3 family protein [Myxococcales bacterium]|nr:cytochrome c3 family protein [Myxococcales bacterium]